MPNNYLRKLVVESDGRKRVQHHRREPRILLIFTGVFAADAPLKWIYFCFASRRTGFNLFFKFRRKIDQSTSLFYLFFYSGIWTYSERKMTGTVPNSSIWNFQTWDNTKISLKICSFWDVLACNLRTQGVSSGRRAVTFDPLERRTFFRPDRQNWIWSNHVEKS